MRRKPISWRTFVFASSLVAVAGGGYAFTSSVHAERSRSQDPRTWDDGKGHIDESRVPDRIAMSSGDLASGVVYIDPHQFYGELGARTDEGPVPVFDQRNGGEQVGTYDLRTGEIAIDLQHSRHQSRPSAVSRTRTTVAAPGAAAPVDSSPATTAASDVSDPTATSDTVTPDSTPSSDPATTIDPGTTVAPVATVDTVDTSSTQP